MKTPEIVEYSDEVGCGDSRRVDEALFRFLGRLPWDAPEQRMKR